MTLSDPQRRSGPSTTSDPPLGPRIDNSVEAQGFSDGHGRGPRMAGDVVYGTESSPRDSGLDKGLPTAPPPNLKSLDVLWGDAAA